MKESQHIEWKESWSDDHLRCVCGFANAEGGTLLIGRDDKGRMAGITNAARLLEELPNKIRDLLGIVVQVNLRREKSLEYLEIMTPAYSSPISYRGHYYQRSGSTLQELKGAALDRFLLRRQGRTWDGVPVPGVAIRDLSGAAIKRFRTLANQSSRVEPGILRIPVLNLIDKLRLNEGNRLKRAALLLFHKDPERFVSGAFVKIGFFRTESDLAYHDEVHGDLFTQVAATIELLQTKYLKAAIRHEVPAPCLRYQANAFWFEFPFADNYIKAVGSHAMRATHEVTPPVTPSVTQPVAVVIRLLGAMGELGSTEIRQQLKLRDRTHLRNRYLDPCLEGGWIERTVPDKPNSRFQRYRLTAKGRAMLEALTHENGLTK